MTSHHSDILLPREAWSTASGRNPLVAFVPILVALLGVAGIMLGSISAAPRVADKASIVEIDPTVTGSILTPAQERSALEMLDR